MRGKKKEALHYIIFFGRRIGQKNESKTNHHPYFLCDFFLYHEEYVRHSADVARKLALGKSMSYQYLLSLLCGNVKCVSKGYVVMNKGLRIEHPVAGTLNAFINMCGTLQSSEGTH